ncbi:MAG: SDR family NAD(P)-dependent oxidoreductase [Casimicrobiaceae bacterium]
MRAAIVSGVSRGLGEALARSLLDHGFRVIGVGRRTSTRLAGPGYDFVEADLAAAERAAAACAAAMSALAREGPAQVVLVNNAALAEPVGRFGTLAETALAGAVAVNLTAPMLLANLFCRIFPGPGGDRRIINVSSGSAQRTVPGAGPYSIAKAGLEMLTVALATDHRDAGFRAVSIRPGIIDTGMQLFMRSQSPEVLPAVPLFQGFHAGGQLVAPATTAAAIVDRLILEPVEHGRTYSYQELAGPPQ